ncbi:MAG: HD domain-containing phosphohydrolase [Actinomycetota bacterium]
MPDDAPQHAAHVLVVDDEEPSRRLLARILQKHGYVCSQAACAGEAKETLAAQGVDLVLTDMDMPGESGLELISEIVAQKPHIATVMVTGRGDRDLARETINVGAYGYIAKPIEPDDVFITVLNALRRRDLEIENRRHREHLEEMIEARTNELQHSLQRLERSEMEVKSSREETIRRLALAAEFRDDDTARHVERMSRYSGHLMALVGESDERVELFRLASALHDVGKIGTPDNILLKAGPLTPAERAVMEMHTTNGHRILSGSDSGMLQVAAVVALTHHERWDGTGYPGRIAGEDIPLEGRIAAIADVFDALTSDRVYRPAFPVEKAVEMMSSERGTQFDATLLDLFVGTMDEICEIGGLVEE